MKSEFLAPVFTESIPSDPEPGKLYISMRYETAVHLCACGCATKVVTPFGRHDWAFTFNGAVSLHPSVGNGQQPCRSHYIIRDNRVEWLPRISKRATQFASSRDRAAHTQPPISAPKPWWRRVWDGVTDGRTATGS